MSSGNKRKSSGEIPLDYSDFNRNQPDDFSTFRDVSNPLDLGRERGPRDIDPNKPVGMADSLNTAEPSGKRIPALKKKRKLRWFYANRK